MKLRYEKISENNIRVASKIQYEIFSNSSAYLKYLKEIQNKTLDLPVDFLIFENDIPIGVVGLYEISKYKDTIWLSWFGVVEDYRYKGYGSQIFEDIINEAKKYNKDFLRLFTYEVWNYEAQDFYKKHMQIEEYYTNKDDDQYDINQGKCKIYGYSLCNKPIDYWNDKFIDISSDDKDHEESIKLMKRDNII